MREGSQPVNLGHIAILNLFHARRQQLQNHPHEHANMPRANLHTKSPEGLCCPRGLCPKHARLRPRHLSQLNSLHVIQAASCASRTCPKGPKVAQRGQQPTYPIACEVHFPACGLELRPRTPANARLVLGLHESVHVRRAQVCKKSFFQTADSILLTCWSCCRQGPAARPSSGDPEFTLLQRDFKVNTAQIFLGSERSASCGQHKICPKVQVGLVGGEEVALYLLLGLFTGTRDQKLRKLPPQRRHSEHV